jgi:hypothetical protein
MSIRHHNHRAYRLAQAGKLRLAIFGLGKAMSGTMNALIGWLHPTLAGNAHQDVLRR